jgi:hypothetical protein
MSESGQKSIKREVEEILDRKVKDEKHYFLVKWKNYKEKYNTWEKRDYLKSIAHNQLKNFEEKLEKMNITDSLKKAEKNQKSEETEISAFALGGFNFNDIPLRIQNVDIVRTYQNRVELNCTIEWKKRKNGEKPKNSIYTNTILKHKCPCLLIDYYESKIKNNYN